MSTQLDDFFKNKLHDRSFEYDESAWEDARILIEENEKSKKRRRWLILFSSFLLVFLVGITAYYLGRESVQPIDQPSTSKSIAEKLSKEEVSNSTTSSISQLDVVNYDNSPQSVTENVVANSSADIRVDTKAIKFNNDITLSGNSSSNQRKNPKEINTKNTYRNALGTAGVEPSSNTPITTIYNPHNSAAVTLKQSITLEHANPKNERLEAISLLSNKAKQLEYHISNDLQDLLPAWTDSPEASPINDSNPKWIFGLRVATNIAPLTFTNFDGGAFVQYNINRNISLSFQPHYTYQELAQEMPDETIVTNGFGLRISSFALSPESIRSIHAPFLVSYSFGSRNLEFTDVSTKRYLKHKLSAGIAYTYLDGITGSVLENEPSGSAANIEQGWFDDSTFNRHNAEVMVGYEYFLTKRLSLGTMLRYRLRNQFTDTFVEQNPTVESIGSLQIGLQVYYRLN